jgi:hypothetical protein
MKDMAEQAVSYVIEFEYFVFLLRACNLYIYICIYNSLSIELAD